MSYYDRYELTMVIKKQEVKMYVAVPKDLPDYLIDEYIKNEVFKYLKDSVRFHYSLKLF